jgi:hypothetical protein
MLEMYCISDDINNGYGFVGIVPKNLHGIYFLEAVGYPARARELRSKRFAAVACCRIMSRLNELLGDLALPNFERYETGESLIRAYKSVPKESRPDVAFVESGILGMEPCEFAKQMMKIVYGVEL